MDHFDSYFITDTKNKKSRRIHGSGIDLIICNVIIKPIVARPRPYSINKTVQLLVTPLKDYSFPSGHTAASFASVSALYFAGKKKVAAGALILSIFIAFSRLYLYVHYPTDVLGGLIIGLLDGSQM